MKTRVGVIFGGRSGEHDISCRSAKTVIEQADPEKYEIVPIAITKEGVWLDAIKSQEFYENGGEVEAKEHKELLFPVSRLLSPDSIDVAFPVLHGTFGEDGTMQGLFEMADIPYVGCGVLASSTGMDKAFMKTLFRDAGLPICNYVWFLRDEWERNRDATCQRVAATLGFPCFVMPANLGSSVGVSKATDLDSLAAAIALAAEYDRRIMSKQA